MGYAFISYSTKNQVWADSVRELFRKNSIETWMAPGDIPAGSKYAMVINRAIKDCSCFVLLLTEDSQNSVWVSKEVERAVNYRKAVIPIQLEDVVLNDEFEFYISTDQVVAMNRIDGDSEEAKKILSAVTAYAGRTLVTEEKGAGVAEAPSEETEAEKKSNETSAETIDESEKKSEENSDGAENKEKAVSEETVSAAPAEEKKAEEKVSEALDGKSDAEEKSVKASEKIKKQPENAEITDKQESEIKKSGKKKAEPVWSKPKDFDIDVVIHGYNKYRKPGLNEIKTAENMSKRLKRNALENIAGSKKNSEDSIAGMFDSSIMGSGKSGILFLRDRFIWKYIGNTLTLRYAQINSAEKNGGNIFIKTRDGMTFELTEPAGARGIVNFLRFIGNRNAEIYGTEVVSSTTVEAIAYANANIDTSLNKFTFSAGVKAEHMAKIRASLGVDDREKVLAVIDTTISGNGKQGVAVTDNKLYWDLLKELSPVEFDQLASAEYDNESNVAFLKYKNGKSASKTIYSSHGKLIFAVLDYIAANRKA